MILTSALILFLLAGLLRGLRNGFYLLHIVLVLGFIALYEQDSLSLHSAMASALFSPQALWMFFVTHTVSINLLTFAAYGYDKSAARRRAWRLPERSLHAMTLVGGTFGAFAAQKLFRHKTRKHRFRVVFWTIGWLQLVAAYVLWLSTH